MTARCGHKVLTLKLLDISRAVQDDPDGARLVRQVEDGILATACRATSFLQTDNPSAPKVQDEASIVQKEVLKYLQTKDKYTALASMLFKSQAFHEVLERSLNLQGQHHDKKRVVDLPRTENNKPFIPISTCHRNSMVEMEEEDAFPISISHQYPFVGMASLDEEQPVAVGSAMARRAEDFVSTPDATHNHNRPSLVGLDIVVFDPINPRLYNTDEEFLDVFRHSFTDNEWGAIQNAPVGSRMQDFYLRWAMKEAYTKAIGVGMGLDFKTFEFVLDGMSWTSSLWKRIKGQEGESDKALCLGGKLRFLTPHHASDAADEQLEFFFLPLYGGAGTAGITSSNMGPREGCACICVQRHPSGLQTVNELEPTEKYPPNLNVVWTDLDQLIKFHSR